MTVSRWLDQSQSITEECDAVIVGAGIAGLSTAYWLQKNYPDWRICLIEKNRVGSGASGRNAGFVTCGSIEHFIKLQNEFGPQEALEIWKFSEENHRLLNEHILEGHPDDFEYAKTGSCTVAPDEDRLKVYRQIAEKMRTNGLDVQEISAKDLQSEFGVSGFPGGLFYAGDGSIHPIKLLEGLRKKLKARIFEGTEVFRIESGKHFSKVLTDRGTFRAKKIFLTLNAYLPLVMPEFSKFIVPGRGQILMTDPLPAFVKGPCYLTKHLCYFRQLPSGHLLIGGFRNLAIQEEATYLDQTTELIQNALFDFVKNYFKSASLAKVAYRWSGIMGFSRDGQMILGSPENQPNIHIMAGCSGHGMGLSFHASKVLVDSLSGKPIPSRLQIQRFSSEKIG